MNWLAGSLDTLRPWKRVRLPYLVLICLMSAIFAQGCRVSYHKVSLVKPKKHFSPYDGKKDRYKKRTKTTRYKSLNHARITRK